MQAAATNNDEVRVAEIVATLSLATDLGTRLPLEHGLESTLVAVRLGERLGIDAATRRQTYYASLLFYVGCTADAEITAELFPDDAALVTHFTPAMFGTKLELLAGLARALAVRDGSALARALHAARTVPRAVREQRRHLATLCEVAHRLAGGLGLPSSIRTLFLGFTERWDGGSGPRGVGGDSIPLAVRIVHVARDAAFHRMVGGEELARAVVAKRAGGAFDPTIAECLVRDCSEIFASDGEHPLWDRVLASEPDPPLVLAGDRIDQALRAMGDFADLVSPHLVGHSRSVARIASEAARLAGLGARTTDTLRRAALVHDLGRVAVPARVWRKSGALSTSEWERVRLHAYHTERVLSRSPFLATVASIAGAHHERNDGSGYHGGRTAATLTPPARLLGAADAYQAMTEPRSHRAALTRREAAETLGREANEGRYDADAVEAVLEVAGQPMPRISRPAGLTRREAEVVGLVARGLQTKSVADALGISVKTADRHIQNAYRKIGVSTRAAAALFAVEHGLAAWGELPIPRPGGRT